MGRDHQVTERLLQSGEVNFDSLRLTKLLSRGVQSVSIFDVTCFALLVKTKEFPDLKINTNS